MHSTKIIILIVYSLYVYINDRENKETMERKVCKELEENKYLQSHLL